MLSHGEAQSSNDQWADHGASPAEDVMLDESPVLGMPSYLTPLIGRDHERRQLGEHLTGAGQSLVVITGSGGIGKTRLAVQVANDLQRSWRHGTRFLPFASVPDTADLDAAFAWQLGLRDRPHQARRESIRQYLQLRETLLVVDNVEHLPHIADLLSFIVTSCASVALLVTSRAALGLYGEIAFPLQPLEVRRSQRQDRSSRIDPALALASPAVRLFVDRVRAIQPDFDVTSDNAADILAICEHLGGVPLALELTASRMAGTTTSDLLKDLAFTFAARPHPYNHRLRHQASLHDTIRASYDLLSRAEQQVFRTLCVMRGMWAIDDVLPLLTPDMPEMDAISVFDSLTARSLLQAHNASDDAHRFVINPVLHRFGEQLVATVGERPALTDRHARRMVDIAIEAEPNLTGPMQTHWLARIDGLHEDFRMALDWLMEQDNAIDALRMSTALWRYAYTRGQYGDVRGWIERALALVDDHDELRSRAFNGIGLLANVSGQLDHAQRAHEQALTLASRGQHHREIAVGRIGLADVAMSAHNDADVAIRHLEIARTAYEHLGDRRGIASVLTNQGNIEWQSGNLTAAFTTHEEASVLYQQAGDTRGVAWSDTNTGRIAAVQGHFHVAVPRLHTALDTYVAVGDISGVAEIMEAIALVTLELGDADRSSMLAGAATALRDSINSSRNSPDLEAFQAVLDALESRADHDHATAFAQGRSMSLEDALTLVRSVETPPAPEAPDAPDHQRLARAVFGITDREYEVLLLICDGLADGEIAERLGIGLRTVHTHVHQLVVKLDAASRVAVIRSAHQAKIVPAR
jgi:non-specific serine/threonine protein kinase